MTDQKQGEEKAPQGLSSEEQFFGPGNQPQVNAQFQQYQAMPMTPPGQAPMYPGQPQPYRYQMGSNQPQTQVPLLGSNASDASQPEGGQEHSANVVADDDDNFQSMNRDEETGGSNCRKLMICGCLSCCICIVVAAVFAVIFIAGVSSTTSPAPPAPPAGPAPPTAPLSPYVLPDEGCDYVAKYFLNELRRKQVEKQMEEGGGYRKDWTSMYNFSLVYENYDDILVGYPCGHTYFQSKSNQQGHSNEWFYVDQSNRKIQSVPLNFDTASVGTKKIFPQQVDNLGKLWFKTQDPDGYGLWDPKTKEFKILDDKDSYGSISLAQGQIFATSGDLYRRVTNDGSLENSQFSKVTTFKKVEVSSKIAPLYSKALNWQYEIATNDEMMKKLQLGQVKLPMPSFLFAGEKKSRGSRPTIGLAQSTDSGEFEVGQYITPETSLFCNTDWRQEVLQAGTETYLMKTEQCEGARDEDVTFSCVKVSEDQDTPNAYQFEQSYTKREFNFFDLDVFSFPTSFDSGGLISLGFKQECVFCNDKMFQGMPDGSMLVRTSMEYEDGARGRNNLLRRHEWNQVSSDDMKRLCGGSTYPFSQLQPANQ